MSKSNKLTGIALATAAAAMFAAAPVHAGESGEKTAVKCMGVNACAGKSSCQTANSSCKGQNSCKGHGFVSVSKDVCDQLGGETG